MHRREVIKQLGLGAASAALNPFLGCRLFHRQPTSKNWAWVVPEKGKDSDFWKEKLETAKACGIDALLIELYNGRTAFYDTDRFPVEEDLLSLFIPLCRSTGLELHAWMWTMPCNVETVVQNHPEWYAVNGKGEPAWEKPAYVDYYKFLCPCNEEAQEFIRGNVESLARISEVVGVHLDYVRLPDVILAPAIQPKYNIVQDKEYPQYDYSYSKSCREQFKNKTGIDPLVDLVDPPSNRAWRQFRYDSVTNLVNNKLVPAARKYGKLVSAAVFPNWEQVRQEWALWDLDCFMPMLYHSFYEQDIHWIAESTREEVRALKMRKPVYSGLFVPSLKPSEIEIAFSECLEAGAGGITLFELKSMNEEQWAALKQVAKDRDSIRL